MAKFDRDFNKKIRSKAKEFDRQVTIPEGLTEDEAVASVIAQYKLEAGVELSDADVRDQVREAMAGRDKT